MESVTVVLYLSSFLLGIWFVRRVKKTGIGAAFMALPLIAMIGLLDEISFGERLLGISMPYIYGVKIDAVHDFLNVGYTISQERWDSDHWWHLFNSLWYVSFLFPLSFFVLLTTTHKRVNSPSTITRLKKSLSCRFVILYLAFAFAAQLFDLRIFGSGTFAIFADEMLEVNGVLALVFASLSIGSVRSLQPFDSEVGGCSSTISSFPCGG